MEKNVVAALTEDMSEDYKQKVRKEEIDSALEQICQKRKLWLCFMFLLTASPGVLNGMHLISYVFYVDSQGSYCDIPELENAGWTPEQIRSVSLPSIKSPQYGCEFYNYDYAKMVGQPFEKAALYVNKTRNHTALVPCRGYKYENNYTVIREWDLVCDRFFYRSNIQAAYAMGKFLGASLFGVISDKYGRRFGFTVASLCYVTSAFLAPFSGTYSVFLIVRFLIGISGVGCYGTAFTLLTEILVGRTKTWICCSFNASYPIGMIILSWIAYYVRYWKSLQLIMSFPTIILPFYYWILPESPQWLLSKNRFEDAWKVIKKIDPDLKPVMEGSKITREKEKSGKARMSILKMIIQPFAKFTSLFSTATLTGRSLICFFSWFTVSTTYFGIAMNGENFTVDRYLYTAINGILEIFSYILPIPMLAVCGRKTSSILLFTVTGASLMSIMFLPKIHKTAILFIACLGRFCDSSVYVILALYTAELFPTAIRNTALGASVTMSHVGTLVSPYIVDILGAYLWYIPSSIFGFLCICTVFLLILLPETKNKPSFNTVEEMMHAEQSRALLENSHHGM